MPKLMHYGLHFTFKTAAGKAYAFDKHQHYGFNANACPPWVLGGPQRSGGVFEYPPRPSELTPWKRGNPEVRCSPGCRV